MIQIRPTVNLEILVSKVASWSWMSRILSSDWYCTWIKVLMVLD